MKLVIDTKETINKVVADEFIKVINSKEHPVIGLATGSTPLGVYILLTPYFWRNFSSLSLTSSNKENEVSSIAEAVKALINLESIVKPLSSSVQLKKTLAKTDELYASRKLPISVT